jgi:hypothetical protein
MRRVLVLSITALSVLVAETVLAPPSLGFTSIAWDTFTSTPSGSSLGDVSALSATDVWAVGLKSGGACQYQTLTEHWNGSSWTVVPSPNVNGVNSVLNGVAQVSANDVWAVGNTSCPTVQGGKTLIEDWTGSSWHIVPSPNLGSETFLQAVDAISANDVWAVGSTAGRSSAKPLILHWNGSSWNVVAGPASAVGVLISVSGSASGDVWAVGNDETSSSGPLVLHWNGTAWSTVPLPTPNADLSDVDSVLSISPTSAWIVGGHRPGGLGTLQPLTWRWNGTAWRFVTTPNVGPFAVLDEVDTAPGAAVWAVGWEVDQVAAHGVVMQLVGRSWTVLNAPVTNFLLGLAVTPDNQLWTTNAGQIFHGVPA